LKPLVKNAADEKQVKDAKFTVEERRRQELNDLRQVLSSVSGRRFVWRVMSHCKAFASIWDSSAKIHYNAGKQDVGHFLIAEVGEADQDAFFLMMQEAQKEKSKNV
jgi:lysyl-tRNA synthetase class II